MIKVITLNIEGDKHFSRWLPFVKKEQPDILLLQELFAADVEKVRSELNMEYIYAPAAAYIAPNQYNISPRGAWGLCVLSKLPINSKSIHYYHGDKKQIPIFQDGQPNSANRAIVVVEVEKNNVTYIVSTTHFTWTPDGKTSNEQRQDLNSLFGFLQNYPELILAGDFNAPRGGEIYEAFTKQFTDHLPQEVTSTLDESLHHAGNLNLAVDSFFSSDHYIFQEIRAESGLSDHKALVALIDKK